MGSKAGAAWTPEDDEQLRTGSASNKSVVWIAAKLKRSMDSVSTRSRLLGVKIKPNKKHKLGLTTLNKKTKSAP
jgi:hypothetical protein